MSVAIHFDLQARTHSHKKARGIVGRLREKCRDLAFREVSEIVELSGNACDPCHYRPDDNLRRAARIIPDGDDGICVLPDRIIAFSAWPGAGCEPAYFGLATYPATVSWDGKTIPTGIRGWCWNSSCETHYSSEEKNGGIPNFLRCHVTVTKVLDFANEIGVVKAVYDLGGYWETRDIKFLADSIESWNRAVERMAEEMRTLMEEL